MGDNNHADPQKNEAGRQDQQREGSIDRQQNQQRDRQGDEGTDPRDNPKFEQSNRLDLDEKGHRDQQV